MTVYLSTDAQKLIRQARAALDAHTLIGPAERCAACDIPGPCAPRRAALRILGQYRQLPHRRPGATRPDLIEPRAGVRRRIY